MSDTSAFSGGRKGRKISPHRQSRLVAAVIESMERRQLLSGVSFNPATSIALIGNPSSVIVGNFTNSGFQDIAAANDNGTVTVLAGNGNNTFKPAEILADGVGDGPAIILSTLIGGDTIALVAANPSTDKVGVLLNGSGGGFGRPVITNLSTYIYNVAYMDVNGDGTPDLITSNTNGSVSVLLGNGNGTFNAPITANTSFDTGGGPIAAFTVSGNTDLAVVNSKNNAVSILLSAGNGSFTASPTTYPTGNDPEAIAAADLFNTGTADLAIANNADGSITVLAGNGDGSFQSQSTIFTGICSPTSIAIADMNHDGRPDLVVTSNVEMGVNVLLQSQNGGFSSAGTFADAGANHSLAVGDINGDGRPDVVTGDFSSQSISVLLNTCSATLFQAQSNLAGSSSPVASATGDLNKDGNADLVVINSNNNQVQIFVGNGDGTFQAPTSYYSVCRPSSVVIGDVNNDGNPDIVVGSAYSRVVGVFLGNGDGTFQSEIDTSGLNISRGVNGIALGDFNGDGNADLAVANNASGTISILFSDGNGSFAFNNSYVVGTNQAYAVVAADLNNDGHPDLVATDSNVNEAYVLINNGAGIFDAPQEYSTGSTPVAIAIGDVTGDGKSDIVLADRTSNQVTILPGNGDGTFGTAITEAVGGSPTSVVLGDVNGDGDLDIITSYTGSATVPGTSVSVLISNDNGSFQPVASTVVGNMPGGLSAADFNHDSRADLVVPLAQASVTAVLLAFPSQPLLGSAFINNIKQQPATVAIGDFNQDGIPDMAVADNFSNEVFVLMGNGDGTFSLQATYGTAGFATSIVTGDFNNDGNADIAVSEYNTGNVVVLLGNGDGTFKSPVTTHLNYGVSYSSSSIAVADFNGDGNEDLVAASGGKFATLLLSNGDGTFNVSNYSIATSGGGGGYSQAPLPSFGLAYAIATGDLDGDGTPDFVVTDTDNNNVSVFLNNSTDGFLGFHNPVMYSVGSDPTSVTTGDLNHDGKTDIVTANGNSGTISVLINNGSGTFNVARNFAAGSRPLSVVLADINGDGKVDVVVADNGSRLSSLPADGVPVPSPLQSNYSGFSILVGNGNGTFQAPAFTPVGQSPSSVAVADLDGDSKPDIILPDYSSHTLNVLFNNTPAPTAPPSTIAVGNGPDAVVSADLNGDSVADLVVANKNSNTIEVLIGNGDGSFQAPLTYNVANSPTSVLVADVNGDGKPDILVLSDTTQIQVLTVFLGSGNGTFSGGTVTTIGHNVASGPHALAVGDFNMDGNTDVMVAGGRYGTISLFLGNNTGSFSGPEDIPIFTAGSSLAVVSSVTAGDLNGDGNPDIVLTDSLYDTVDVLHGNGDGTFALPVRYTVGNSPSDVVIATLVGEGSPDLIVANGGDNTVSVLVGNGTGVFQSPQTFLAGNYATSLAVGDFNGDGIPDIATSNPGTLASPSNLVTILSGNGDGTFAAPKFLVAGNGPVDITAADLNGDGTTDIVTANSLDNTLSLLMNTQAALAVNISSAGGMITVNTTPGNDTGSISVSGGFVIITINGQTESFPISSTNEVVIGLEAGDDSLTIGAGVPSCSINGGGGNDTIVDNSSALNTLIGGAGNDSLHAGSGADIVHGGLDNDTITGGGPGTFLAGNTGNDVLETDSSGSTVRGGQGSDTVSSTEGGDSIRGGGGDDIIIDFGATLPDTVDGGVGLNFAQNNPKDVMVNIFEVFDPTLPPSALPGAAAAAIASAPAASFPANAAPADGSPVTSHVSADGILVVIGGSDSDTIAVTTDGTNIIVTANGSTLTTKTVASLTGLRLNGKGGNDVITVDSAVLLPATLLGGAGNDSLVGGGGDNVLIGGGASDTLVGGAGTNLLVGGLRTGFAGAPSGNDVLDGGAGYSIADFSRRTDPLHLSNDGLADSGDTSAGETTTIMSNVAAIWGGTAADTIVATTAGEFISGGGGADSITGGGANGVIVGGLGKDTVIVNAEPVALYLQDGKKDRYSGISNPLEDILELDDGLDTTLGV